MKPVKVVAADDEPGVLLLIHSILSELDGIQLVGTAGSAMEAIKLVDELKPDLALLDIGLPDMAGIELAEKLREVNPDLYIVFITAHSEYTFEAYRLYAYDYIVKPVDKERVKTTVRRIQQAVETEEKARENQTIRPPTRLSVRLDNEQVFINPDTIYFVERSGRHTVIHCAKGKFTISETLQELEQRLGPGFFRSHKSYIINIERLERVINLPKSSCFEVKFHDYNNGKAQISRDRVHDLYRLLKT